LFIHKQWSDRTRKRYLALKDHPTQKRLWTLAGWFVTFHFVALGWVWFALPGIDQSADVLGKLFGM
jgi:D-alanyl-lipoteichoic acid acyltransferase DltB (MBOAT superfamily)